MHVVYMCYGDQYGDAMFSRQRSAMNGKWFYQGVAGLSELMPELLGATPVRLGCTYQLPGAGKQRLQFVMACHVWIWTEWHS